jgi:hypothetical protein
VSFTLLSGGQSYAVVSHIWIVKRRNELFTIGMSGPSSRAEELEPVFLEIHGSIALEPPRT